MPLSGKGSEILANMRKEYGKEKGERVFYASKNKGTIKGVDGAERLPELAIRSASEGAERVRRFNEQDADDPIGQVVSDGQDMPVQRAIERVPGATPPFSSFPGPQKDRKTRVSDRARDRARAVIRSAKLRRQSARDTIDELVEAFKPLPSQGSAYDKRAFFKGAIRDSIKAGKLPKDCIADAVQRMKDEHIGFKKLEGELAHKKGIHNAGAVAAAIGRKKYGSQGMAKKSAAAR